jgi:hypothetical protein
VCERCLTPSSRLTFDAIVLATQEARYQGGVPPLALVPYLGIPDVAAQLTALIHEVPLPGSTLLTGEQMRRLLRQALIAEEDARKGYLKDKARALACSTQPKTLAELIVFTDTVQFVHAQRVQQRVQALRDELKACREPDRDRLTVSRAPYRIVRVAAEAETLDDFAALYPLLQRPAWQAPLGCFMEESVVTVHRRLRYALRSGRVLDDGLQLSGYCAPAHTVKSAPLRAALDRVRCHSELFQDIFNSFYEPELAPGDYRCAMRMAARPHAVEVIVVLTALRNAITTVFNDIGKTQGWAPLPLGAGYGWFPRHPQWIPAGSVPAGPMQLPAAELLTRATELLRIGVDVRYKGRERFLGKARHATAPQPRRARQATRDKPSGDAAGPEPDAEPVRPRRRTRAGTAHPPGERQVTARMPRARRTAAPRNEARRGIASHREPAPESSSPPGASRAAESRAAAH